MSKASIKIYTILFFLLSIFILLFIIGCSNTFKKKSESMESSRPEEQILPADSVSKNEAGREGVPFPPDKANGIYIDGDYAFVADYIKGVLLKN